MRDFKVINNLNPEYLFDNRFMVSEMGSCRSSYCNGCYCSMHSWYSGLVLYISQLSPAIRVICLESKLPFEKKPFLVVGLESVEPGIW